MYTEVEKKLAQQVPWLPISHEKPLSAYRPDVKNFSVHSSGNIFFANIYKN
jgi:peptide/nickel transport system substrate-binding protein